MEETPVVQQTYGAWRPQKYFVTKRPLSGVIVLFVSVGLLIGRLRMSEKTLRNGISKFTRGSSRFYQSFKDGDSIMIDYDTIPANCKSKLKLPTSAEDTYAMLQGENYLQEQVTRDAEFKNLKNSLEELYRHRWPQFLKFYKEKITDRNEGILFGQSHALLYGVIEARKERWPSKVVFEAVRQIMVAEINAMKEPIFYSFSPVYFWRKVAKCRLRGIAVTLIHEARGVEREYRVKMTGQIKAFIRLEFRKPQRLTVRKIINSVLRRFGVELSESSVKSIKNNSHDRNIIEYDSNGVIHGRQNGLPKVIRFLAQSPGDQFQGDWYKLQVYYKDEFNRQKRLWVYVVLDVFSAKVVGWSLCEKILASSAKEAFKMAFTEHHILPEEIIIDNESKYNHPVFKRFVRKLNNLGVIVTKAYPNIPTWKAEIESFFAVFQKLHSDKSWYIGEDIQSKNIAGNPNDEVRKKIYQDVKNMLTRDQLEIEFSKMVKEYNAMTNNRKKKVSPQETYRMFKPKHAKKFEDWFEPLLFWKTKTKKRIKNDGRIDLQLEGEEYCYQITKAEQLWTHKNTDVRMCYNPKDLSKIYIYERFTHNFIGMIEPRLVMDRNNKKEVMKKQRRILRDAQQWLKDHRKRDEALANGESPDRHVITQETREDKMIRLRLKRKKFEDEVKAVKVEP
ncbi:MAG TPA: transposase family protein [Cyclobacteriaceae bacterium]|jgi:hypothetical protein|nr:transposase family protein [Cyclobacteriaceae bacterium]